MASSVKYAPMHAWRRMGDEAQRGVKSPFQFASNLAASWPAIPLFLNAAMSEQKPWTNHLESPCPHGTAAQNVCAKLTTWYGASVPCT